MQSRSTPIRSLSALLLVTGAVLIPLACGGSAETVDGPDIEERMDIPAWWNVPEADGFYYGYGQAVYKNTMMLQNAMDTASLSAREQLAATVSTRIQGVTQRYMRGIMTAEGDIEEEAMSQSVSEALVNGILTGGEICDTFMSEGEDGKKYVWVRARLSYEDAARSAAETMKAKAEGRLPSDDEVRDELVALMDEMHREINEPTSIEEAAEEAFGDTTPEPEPRGDTPEDWQTLWLQPSDPRFPNSEWLLGVGTAPANGLSDSGARNAADGQGRQDIQATFSTRVRSTVESMAQQVSQAAADGSFETFEQMSQSASVETIVSGTVQGAEVLDRQFDGTTLWSLVGLNKRATASRLRTQIEQELSAIRADFRAAQQAHASELYLEAIRLLLPLPARLQALFGINEQYIMIRPNTTEFPDINLDEPSLEDILTLLRECSLEVAIVFVVDAEVTYHEDYHNGATEKLSGGVVIDKIMQVFSSNDFVGVTRRSGGSEFSRLSADQVSAMNARELQRYLDPSEVGYVIVAHCQTMFSSNMQGRLQVYRTTYDVAIIDVSTGRRVDSIADADGNDCKGMNRNHQIAANRSLEAAARAIGQELGERWGG